MAASFGKRLAARRGFVATVYAILVLQVLITAGVVAWLRAHPDERAALAKWRYLWIALSLAAFMTLLFVPAPPAVRLLLFAAFAAFLGLLSAASSRRVSEDAIWAAILSTLAVFSVMTLVGFAVAAAGVDLSVMAFALLMALLGLLVVRLVTLFYPVSKPWQSAIVYFGVALFSVLVAFDTNLMLMARRESLDAVDAAAGLYLDVVNLFNGELALGNS